MPLMHSLLFLFITATVVSAAEQTGFARAIMEKKRPACKAAKAEARAAYTIVHLDPGCFCEKTDDGLWLCDVRFTHAGPKAQAER